MTMMQYLSTFRLYSSEVLLLALGVTLCTSLLKKTLLKNLQSKAYVFLPFGLGVLFYAVFRIIVTTSFSPLTSGLGATLEGGFACGCAATLYYVVWEQFFRSRESAELPPVYPLLEGYVPESKREEVAEELCTGSASIADEGLHAFVEETLGKYVAVSVPRGEFDALVKLVEEFLRSLRGDKTA